KTLEKETIELTVEPVVIEKLKEPHKPYTKEIENTNQKSIKFTDIESQEDDGYEFEILYTKPVDEQKVPKDSSKMDFTSASEEDLDEMENIPAYKRRQLRMNDPRYKKQLSNYSVTNENKIADKNSYLHGQVD